MEKVIGGKSHARLLLADDHAIFSDALRLYLEKGFDIVGVVSDGRTLVDEAIRIKPDVIIVDVGMPLLNGLDAARRIKELAPKIKFIFLTMQDDPNLAAAALERMKGGFEAAGGHVQSAGDGRELVERTFLDAGGEIACRDALGEGDDARHALRDAVGHDGGQHGSQKE